MSPLSPSPAFLLDPGAVVATAERLERRVGERFPGRGLARVARDLAMLARAHEARAGSIRRPAWGIRAGIAALLLFVLCGAAWLVAALRSERVVWSSGAASDLLQGVEAGVGVLVFLGAAVVFLLSLELRVKRRRALEALHELRALAHVIDMHQLTKDPERVLGHIAFTTSSPRPDLTPAELGRYLDYCCEMLSLLGKIAALYVQAFADPVAVNAVDDVESLTTGLSGRIGQKLLILDRWEREASP